MMRAGVPLLQAFDIAGRGSTNPRVTKLLGDIRADVETAPACYRLQSYPKPPLRLAVLHHRGRRGRRYPGNHPGPLVGLHGAAAALRSKTVRP